MAAALRFAAMRLGGRALQASALAPAVEEQHRLLLPRLVHTRPTTIDEKKYAAIRLTQIDEKTEELYNLIADLETKYKVPGRIGRQNGLLLEQLSLHVEPRSNDPHWPSCRRTQRIRSFFTSVGICSIGFMSPFALYWLITEVDPKRDKLAIDWWNKQQR